MLRVFTFCLFFVSALLGGANAYFNELRASSGCGPEYSWAFSKEIGLKLALVNGLPIFGLGVISFIASVKPRARVLSVFVAVLILLFSSDIYFANYFSGYAPCDVKGDESSLHLLLGTIVLWGVWVGVAGMLLLLPRRQDLAGK